MPQILLDPKREGIPAVHPSLFSHLFHVQSPCRSYSEMMFDFDYLLPSQKEHNDRVKETVAPFRRYLDRCTPVRVYRKPNNTKHLDIKLQVRLKTYIHHLHD